MVATDPHCWIRGESIIYNNSDTVSLVNISVSLRYNNSFRSDTLSVTVQTSLPDARQCIEPVVLHLAREYSATAVVSSESVLYRSSCRLAQMGEYIFTITPRSAVKGIEAVGIQIDR